MARTRSETPKPVRNFALYGTSGKQPAWADLVHVERIPVRSSLFDWEIDLHFHDALIQVLYPVRGGGEAVIDGVRWHTKYLCAAAPADQLPNCQYLPMLERARMLYAIPPTRMTQAPLARQ